MTKKAAQDRRAKYKAEYWPHEIAWTGEDSGWFRAPRTLPLILALLRTKKISGNQDPSGVYLELLGRHRDTAASSKWPPTPTIPSRLATQVRAVCAPGTSVWLCWKNLLHQVKGCRKPGAQVRSPCPSLDRRTEALRAGQDRRHLVVDLSPDTDRRQRDNL